MKTNHSSLLRSVFLILPVLAGLLPGTNLHAQILVANENSNTIGEYNFNGTPVGTGTLVSSGLEEPLAIAVSGSYIFVTNQGNEGVNSYIGEYTTAGAPVGTGTLVSGVYNAFGIAVSGSDIFVTNYYDDIIKKYTTAGAPVGTGTLVSGLNGPEGIAVSGSYIFVTNNGNGTIGKYTTSGSTVNASLVTGLESPIGIAVSGSDIFVIAYNGTIGEYITSGSTVNASLVTSIYSPFGIAVSGSDILATNAESGFISEFLTTSGTPVGTGTLVSGLNQPEGIAVIAQGAPVPAAPSWALLVTGAGLIIAACRRVKVWREISSP